MAAPLRGSGLQETMSHTMVACCSNPIGSSRALSVECLPLFPLLSSSSSGLSLRDSFLGRSQMAICKAKIQNSELEANPVSPCAV